MSLAARAALRAHGLVEPNPMVGCVLARDGHVLAIGHHQQFGLLHAERQALASCRSRGIDPRGATAYVTLEPCNGHGKQPPCTQALIDAGIARVVYAISDPNPSKSGGADLLGSRGIVVDHLAGHALAERLSAPFIKNTMRKLPWVTAKWAQTLDGRIATRTGQSQWISSKHSRRRVHRLRSRVDAILTGIGTVLADDPLLTARADCGARRVRRPAARIILDSKLMTPLDSKLIATAGQIPTVIITTAPASAAQTAPWTARRDALARAGARLVDVHATPAGEVDLSDALSALFAQGISTLLVEAGPRILGSLIDARLIDEAIIHLAPMVMGDEEARPVASGRVAPLLSDSSRWQLLRAKPVGPDLELIYKRL